MNAHDKDIRPQVLAMLAPIASWVRPECGFGTYARVDIAALVNRELCGYEIKAHRDSLRRLQGPPEGMQVQEFSRIFDRVVLVVAPKHLRRATLLVPEWWGLTVATDTLEVFRPGEVNPGPASARLARALWVREARSLASRLKVGRGMVHKGDLIECLSECSEEDLRAAVNAALPVRQWVGS